MVPSLITRYQFCNILFSFALIGEELAAILFSVKFIPANWHVKLMVRAILKFYLFTYFLRYSSTIFFKNRKRWELCGLLHFLDRSFKAWFLINGKKWVGRVEIHLLISGYIFALSSYHPFWMFLCCFRSWHVHFFWTNFVNRGAGFISLENLLFFAKTFSVRCWIISWWHHFNPSLPNLKILNIMTSVFAQLLPKIDLFAYALMQCC